jgi:hypothetical protein
MAYYASPDERDRLIGGLRALAEFLHHHTEVPAPRWADVLIFPPDGTDEEERAEIDAIASRIGTATSESPGGHHSACLAFGPVTYRAIAIPETREEGEQRP